MATPTTPTPTETTTGISAESIAAAGEGLTRVLVAAITLPITTANSVGAGISRLIASATAALDGATSPQAQTSGSNDIAAATSNLVSSVAGLYLGVVKSAIAGVDSATNAVNKVVAEVSEPKSK